MKKKMLKKSDVLREGYVQGLKKAQCIINEMIEEEMMNERFRWNAGKDATNLVIKYFEQCVKANRTPDANRLKRIDTTVNGKVDYDTLIDWCDSNSDVEWVKNFKEVIKRIKSGKGLSALDLEEKVINGLVTAAGAGFTISVVAIALSAVVNMVGAMIH